MINWGRVHELKDEIGQEDFDEIVEIFLEEVEQVIEKLRDDPDRSNLRDDLHFLKGSALNLGFSDLSTRCQAGETTSAQGHADRVDLSAILDCYFQSKRVFEQGLAA